MKPSIVNSSPAVVSKVQSIIEDTYQEVDTSDHTDSGSELTLEQDQELRYWLSKAAVFQSDAQRKFQGRETIHTRPYPFPELMSFVDSVFDRAEEVGSNERTVSWVEINGKTKSSYLSNVDLPVRFTVCRDLVKISPKRNAEGDKRRTYTTREMMRIEFRLSRTTRGAPILNCSCDRASFENNAFSKYHLYTDLGPVSSKTYFKMFLLYPLQELNRFMEGESLSPNDRLFRRKSATGPLFPRATISLNDAGGCAAFHRMMLDSLSIHFHPSFSEEAVEQIVRNAGGTAGAVQDFVRRLMAVQVATYGAVKFFGAHLASFSHVTVTPQFEDDLSGWKDRDEGVALDKASDVNSKHIRAVTIAVFNPTSSDRHFTIHLELIDSKKVSKQLKYKEFDRTRTHQSDSLNRNTPSADQQLSKLDKTWAVTVTCHSRMLRYKGSPQTVTSLFRRIESEYEGSIEDYYRGLVEKAVDQSGLDYWNNSSRWLPCVEDSKTFKGRIDRFFQEADSIKHFEVVSPERLDFMKKLPNAMANGNTEVLAQLKAMFKTSKMMKNGSSASKKYIDRIRAVPEFSLAFVLLWHFYPDKNTFALMSEWDLIPEDWRKAFTQPRRVQGPGLQAVMDRFANELRDFSRNNFGIDLRYARGFHVEIARKQLEALNGNISVLTSEEIPMRDQFRPSMENVASYGGLFFRKMLTGELINSEWSGSKLTH